MEIGKCRCRHWGWTGVGLPEEPEILEQKVDIDKMMDKRLIHKNPLETKLNLSK